MIQKYGKMILDDIVAESNEPLEQPKRDQRKYVEYFGAKEPYLVASVYTRNNSVINKAWNERQS